MAWRLLGLGDNTVDTYVDRGLQFPGGNAVNVAVQAKRLGAETGYLGCIGSDEAGMLLCDALRQEGVDTSRCRIRLGRNARAFIGHDGQDRRFLRSERGVRGEWGAFDTEDLSYIAGYDLVHSSIYSELGEALPPMRGAPRRLSYDFSERWTAENLAATLPAVDIAFLSHPSASDAECRTLLERCIGWGAGMVVATRGARGALALAGGRFHEQPARPASVVDTLGAGDGFIAAFLLAILDGSGTAAALAAGADHAAQVCGYQGGFGHGVAWTQVDAAVL
ncbi:fructoselysine kinase [Bosea sp. SSUT16]|uniref:Fructoselysine kinase n=1 Tax=Bosea spartocytisi TaxID=2773451 RepID=A0A927E7Q7_9HYPH|nr:PfkB family carbohydrate kinase [Bosea spartocytisi]MBD3845280.1 fructoselysine kinase [Bosea spartocytisi]MCT4472451.1 PfkB family carbohydrate kinase [Bosea spartocytisi]